MRSNLTNKEFMTLFYKNLKIKCHKFFICQQYYLAKLHCTKHYAVIKNKFLYDPFIHLYSAETMITMSSNRHSRQENQAVEVLPKIYIKLIY